MKRMLIPILPVLLLLSACQGIPRTEISMNPRTGAVTIYSPKEIDAEDLEVTTPSGVKFKAKLLKSHNSPDVIASQAAANALQLQKASELLEKASQLVEKLGVKGATGF